MKVPLTITALCAIASVFAPARVNAIQYPLTPQSVQAAIAYGQAHRPQDVLAIPELNFRDATGWKPSIVLTTPWTQLAFDASYAQAHYQNLEAAAIKSDSKSKTLEITAYAFDKNEIDSNDDANIVIQQAGKIVNPVRLSLGEKYVTEFPEVGYKTPIHAMFSLPALKIDQPFTVIVAGVSVGEYQTGEVRYEVDPKTFN